MRTKTSVGRVIKEGILIEGTDNLVEYDRSFEEEEEEV